MTRRVLRFKLTYRDAKFVQLRFRRSFLKYIGLVEKTLGFQILKLLLNGGPSGSFFRNFQRSILVSSPQAFGLAEVVIDVIRKSVRNLRFVNLELLSLSFEALLQ